MTGAELIAEERRRQIEQEGWSPDHDDGHTDGELIRAATGYLLGIQAADSTGGRPEGTPPEWWKPTWGTRELVKAGALIAAEIDRRERAGLT